MPDPIHGSTRDMIFTSKLRNGRLLKTKNDDRPGSVCESRPGLRGDMVMELVGGGQARRSHVTCARMDKFEQGWCVGCCGKVLDGYGGVCGV
jgi:hypothetical protein